MESDPVFPEDNGENVPLLEFLRSDDNFAPVRLLCPRIIIIKKESRDIEGFKTVHMDECSLRLWTPCSGDRQRC